MIGELLSEYKNNQIKNNNNLNEEGGPSKNTNITCKVYDPAHEVCIILIKMIIPQ